MLSVSGKNWEETLVSKRIIDKLKIDHDLSELTAKLIIDRGFTHHEIYSIKKNIRLLNPFLNNSDFLKCNSLLKKNIDNRNKILVLGDYDVDGCVSTSLMVNFIKKFKVPVSYYIPNRVKDGYGANLNLIKRLVAKEKPDLLIMLDCGSNSSSSIKYLKNNKIETLIIDHHNVQDASNLPTYLINPKKKNSYNQYDYLCSAFLTYLFLDSYTKLYKLNISIKDNLIYVLLATVSDVMPLRHLNRFLAQYVLKSFDINNNFIIKNFFLLQKINKKIDINDFSFFIGPLINSAGRMDDANIVVDLFTSENSIKKKKIIEKLFILNEKRKNIENEILNKIDLNFDNRQNVIFIYNMDIHEGIKGIIASRIKEIANKPCIVLTKVGNIYKGSARSTENFNVGELINKAIKNGILISGGGHNLAAGVALKEENIEKFKKFLEFSYLKNCLMKNKQFISKMSINSINKKFYNTVNSISPYGAKNERPLFLIENIKIIKPTIIKEKFVSCLIKSISGKLVKAISFNPINSKISFNLLYNKEPMNIILRLNDNNWNNKNSLQIEIVDIIIDFNKT